MRQSVAGQWRVGGGLQVLLGLWLHESLVVPVFTYGSEKGRSRITAVHVDNLRGLLGIRRMDKIPNARMRQLCGDEKIDKGVLRQFGHVERMENDRIPKRDM